MRGLDALQEFIRKLNYHLKHDYYYSFLIKCACDEDISSDNIKACRRWFRKEFEKVDPYLIIMMGKYSTAACLGGKYYKLLQENIFYTKTGEDGIKRQYFVGADINASESRLKENLNYLERFIKDFYNAS
jgi:uracil-DNA glycosylase